MSNNTISQLMDQAVRALNAGSYPKLQKLCQQILKIDPGVSDAWFFMSIVADAARQPGHAVQLVERALQIEPENVEYLSLKARYHTRLNQYHKAFEAANLALDIGSDSAIVLDTLGVVFTWLAEYEKARQVLLLATNLGSDNPQFHFNLASVEQFLGNAEAARAAYEKALALKPDFCRAHWALSELEKNQPDPKRTEQLENLLENPGRSSEDELYLAHALSREYEKLEDYQRAFDCLARGKRRQREKVKYSPQDDASLFATIAQVFEEAGNGTGGSEITAANPVFIVGMPRTGTTLLDRILGSHSMLTSLGERQEFAHAVKKVSATGSAAVLDSEVVTKAGAADPRSIAELYLQMLGSRIDHQRSFIDKMPLNFLCTGFILAGLPQASVICMRRNPLDTCLSNYRQLFALDFSYYNYNYDLADTARYFVQFDRLMAFWQKRYPQRFYQVDYEKLVRNPESEVKAVFAFLGIPFEPACLNFHHNTQAVATASTMQVRQPLYTDAIARWHKYRCQLAPAIEILTTAGIDWQ